MYPGGGVSKYAGKQLADYGAREIDRVMALPDFYRGPLTEAMSSGGGEKMLGSLIFVLNSRDPQFREAWKNTEHTGE